MLVDIFLSLILAPKLPQNSFSFEDFFTLNNQPAAEASATAPQRVYSDFLDVEITAKSALAIDTASDQVLYSKNPEQILPIASITKLMTALVFLEHNPGWQKEWSTIASDRRNGGIIYLNTGEILTLADLFKTVLIVSDNDSAMALSRATGLDETQFIAAMNAKAKELNLVNTKFADPTGLKLANQSTVVDVAKLLKYALQKEAISQAVGTAYYEFEVKGLEKNRLVKLRNTDFLLKSYLDVLGGKTGSLEEAGYCLAVKIRGEQNQEIIVVVLKSQTQTDRFQDVKAIADWVFNNYQWMKK